MTKKEVLEAIEEQKEYTENYWGMDYSDGASLGQEVEKLKIIKQLLEEYRWKKQGESTYDVN